MQNTGILLKQNKMKTTSNKISVLIFTIIVLITSHIKAQDIHFSQFRETPMLINPGQTALIKDVRIILNYKDQWRSFVSPYKTFAFSGELKATKDKKKDNYIGLGLQLFSDKAGDSQMGTMLASLNVSGIVKVSDNSKLGIGIMAGAGQHTVNYTNLQWESQYVGTSFNSTNSSGETQTSSSFIYPDAGAGIAWTYGKEQMYISANNGVHATVGFSAFHFGLPNYSFYKQSTEKLNTKFVGHGSIEFGIKNSKLLLSPQFLYTRQGKQQEIIVGNVFKYILQEESKYTLNKKASAISLGVDLRLGDAMITSIMYEYSFYALGISYDLNVSKLKAASYFRGGLELAIHFTTPSPFSNTSSKARFN